jgi:hypothetical protein
MLTLYYSPGASSVIPHITLEEIRVPYQRKFFADRSQSIPDSLMALLSRTRAWNYSAETARSAVGCSPCSGSERVN